MIAQNELLSLVAIFFSSLKVGNILIDFHNKPLVFSLKIVFVELVVDENVECSKQGGCDNGQSADHLAKGIFHIGLRLIFL